jgi:histidine triad (HIT) family protein
MTESDCIFCRIAAGDIPADLVHEDDQVLAFRDIAPQAPLHALVIPRKHIPSVASVDDEDQGLMGRLVTVARDVAAAEGVASTGYRLVINAGSDGGQAVDHLHLHVLGGRGMGWPPG